jgi:hypothetical protein
MRVPDTWKNCAQKERERGNNENGILWLEKINQNLKIKRDFYFDFWRSFRVCELLRSGVACFPSIVCTSKAKGVVESGDLRLNTSSSSWHPLSYLKWCIHTWLDVKSVLNENLGGILGGTQYENLGG